MVWSCGDSYECVLFGIMEKTDTLEGHGRPNLRFHLSLAQWLHVLFRRRIHIIHQQGGRWDFAVYGAHSCVADSLLVWTTDRYDCSHIILSQSRLLRLTILRPRLVIYYNHETAYGINISQDNEFVFPGFLITKCQGYFLLALLLFVYYKQSNSVSDSIAKSPDGRKCTSMSETIERTETP